MRCASVILLSALIGFSNLALAAEPVPQDDRVILNLTAEDWVKTDTARVVVGVEAAVTGSSAGNARSEMSEAVGEIVSAEWRLTNFARSQDQTGMERWSASFEARLPENKLSGLSEAAKKHSRAGMQLSIAAIDFSPTLAEVQKGYDGLRANLYKAAKDQLTTLDAALPERGYRISLIDFTNGEEASEQQVQPPRMLRAMAANKMMVSGDAAAPMERAEKISLTAHIVLAATPVRPVKNVLSAD